MTPAHYGQRRLRAGASRLVGQLALLLAAQFATLDALFAQTPAASEQAAAAASQFAGASYGSGGYLAQLIGGLAFVVIAILVFAWFMRRFSGTSSRGLPRAIEILAVRSVGTRERLMLVQVGEEQVLIGVSPTGMRALHRLEKPLKSPSASEPSLGKKAGVDFASLLRKQMSKTTDA
ncbi:MULTISPECIES: flagellar biosynthetic protein FliO [Thiorhodovibrio]|uniref:flagellar biosynthetic protein FliO n=1 Tax=Thiorhodovibrio TaxID=61593 RepID=UPI002B257C88|nr:flagellar biosynthetic protein FliO [Thiorhodovibrio litoralis]WPL10622.1 Flagellar protein FliO [Thiorhodovibrio litoralis]